MSTVHSTYPVSVRWIGGKQGVGTSPDWLPALEVATPPAFGGPGGAWSPEHLLALAVASCWMSTFVAMAEQSSLTLAAVDVTAEATVDRREDRRFWVPRIVLRPRVTVRRPEDSERAERLVSKAEAGCLVSNSLAGEVLLEGEVVADRAHVPVMA
jgi:peroxiredoxin-like protein